MIWKAGLYERLCRIRRNEVRHPNTKKASYHPFASHDKTTEPDPNLCRREAAEWMIL